MSFIEIMLLALALSLDACAVALASTVTGRIRGRRSAFRLSFHFGLFQFLMPLVGWAAGTTAQPYIADYDHWIACALLTFVGLRMIKTAFHETPPDSASDPSRGWILVTLAFATSIDALAVGLGLAAMGVSAWYPSTIIGLVTMVMTMLAIAGGIRVGPWLGSKAQIVGGVVLLLIGLKFVITDLM